MPGDLADVGRRLSSGIKYQDKEKKSSNKRSPDADRGGGR